VDHAVLSASGVATGQARRSLVVIRTPEKTLSYPVTFQAMSRDEATVWLRGVVRELLRGPHAYFLPCEAIFAHARRGEGGPLVPFVEEARAILGDAEGALPLRSAYGPVPRPQGYPAPDEPRAAELARTRFGAFFRKRVTERAPDAGDDES
jgi:exodeoxyribonuclease V gamma subunit